MEPAEGDGALGVIRKVSRRMEDRPDLRRCSWVPVLEETHGFDLAETFDERLADSVHAVTDTAVAVKNHGKREVAGGRAQRSGSR